MFREMIRKDKETTKEMAIKIFEEGSHGILAVLGDDNYPYTVPLSYVYLDEKIFFHCAKQGHKLDAISNNDKVSFCVVGKDHVIPERFSTDYKSAVAFGKARIVEEKEEVESIMMKIGEKYSPGYEEGAKKYIKGTFEKFSLVEIKIDHITGKGGK